MTDLTARLEHLMRVRDVCRDRLMKVEEEIAAVKRAANAAVKVCCGICGKPLKVGDHISFAEDHTRELWHRDCLTPFSADAIKKHKEGLPHGE